MPLVMTEFTIPGILDRLMASKKLSERGLATYLSVSSNAVNGWRRGLRVPPPAYCKKIADYAGLTEEEVLRAAGHLVASSGSDPDAGIIPEVRAALRKMTAEEQRLAALPAIELAEELLRAGRGKAQE